MASIDHVGKRQARQRGAWRENARELKDADFSFKFGGTPSTAGRSSKTPLRSARGRSNPSLSAQSTGQARSTEHRSRINQEDAVAAKANKRSSTRSFVTPLPKSTKRKRAPGADEEDELAEHAPSDRSSTKSRRVTTSTINELPELDEDELNHDSPEHDQSALNSSLARRRISITDKITPPQRLSQSKHKKIRRKGLEERHPLTDIDDNSVVSLPQPGSHTHKELSSKTRAAVNGSAKQSAQQVSTAARSDEAEISIADEETDEIAGPQINQRHATPVARSSNVDQKAAAQAEPSRRTAATRRSRSLKPSSESAGATVPIKVYRPSQRGTADGDPLGAVPIPSMNPCDVMAQCLSELCKMHLQRLKRQEGISGRQLVAIMEFKNAIQDSLFDVSVAQNSVYALTGRLRRVKRQQSDLRSELMRVKTARDNVALRMDSLRSHYLLKSKEQGKSRQLLRDLEALREAARTHRESITDADELEEDAVQHTDIGELLQDVEASISRGGILQALQAWNTTMAAALTKI